MKGKIFNAQEVQAMIAGTKTMFREVLKTCKHHPNNLCQKVRNIHYGINLKDDGLFWQPYGGSELQPFPYCDGKLSTSTSLDKFCPYQVGQKIKPKPKSGSIDLQLRLFGIELLIKKIRVERLADISEDDAIKEGATSRPHCHGYANIYNGWSMDWSKVGEASKWASNRKTLSESDVCMGSAQYAFGNYWNATHKKVEHKWEANPWVFVYEFEVLDLKK